MKNRADFYEKLLFGYLAVYGVLHLAAIIILFSFERGWGGFVYILAFWLHLPVFLVASLVSLLGKKTKYSLVWLLASICFLLSNGHWCYMSFQEHSLTPYLPFVLLTVIPIFASTRLVALTRK